MGLTQSRMRPVAAVAHRNCDQYPYTERSISPDSHPEPKEARR